MENKQTAVEWLAQKLDIAPDNPLLAQAKAMEKEQHIELRAESYKQAMFDASKYLVDKLKFKNYGQ